MQLIDSLKSSTENVYKLVFEEGDAPVMEVSVIRKGDGKDILCVPTQTNCKMGCKFCHLTGLDIPSTNLSPDKIVELVDKSLKFTPQENQTLLVSYMGVGEPLLNVEGMIKSALLIRERSGYSNIRFGVSTLIPSVKQFDKFKSLVMEYDLPFKLHWSLHSTKSEVRKYLMPRALDIKVGAQLIANYIDETKQPAEVHYTLINNINDQMADVKNIESFLDKRLPIKILRFAPAKLAPALKESDNLVTFTQALESAGYKVEIYSPPGRDIGSSCGQFILDKYTT